MEKKQRTYLGLRPIFMKRFLRGSVKCLPYLGNLLDEIIFGVLDEESAKAESEKIHNKLAEIIQGQGQQEADFAEILLALHIQTDVNEKLRTSLKEIEESLRDTSGQSPPEYFERALDTVIGGNEQIYAELQTLAEQQALEHKQIAEKLDETKETVDEILKRLDSGISEETRRAIENIFMAILKEEDIPQWQWAEKLQEITKRHQDLLDKWQMVQSGDPAVDELRHKAHGMIEIGDHDKAHQLLQEAIEINRKAIQSQQETLDKRKLSTAQLLADQADIAETRLDYKKAIALYKEALDTLPQNEQKTQADYMSNLGLLYITLANYKEAEPLMKRALAIDEASLGSEHPEVATDLNNLALLYQATNRLKEAEPLMKRALKMGEASFGSEHPIVATRLNNLALLYEATNRLAEAEPLYKRALAIHEASLGSEHPDVAIDLSNLAALLYLATNRLKEAEPLMKRALKIDEASLGSEHPNVAIRLNNLATLYQDTNRHKEAEPLAKRALAIDEASLGSEHPNVARDLNNLARLYQATNRLKEAEPLRERCLVILLQFTRRTGHPHPNLETAIENYSDLLIQMGHSDDDVNNRLKRLAPEFFDKDG